MKAADIRQRFLDFFGERDHHTVRSSSLVPHNDPTLFFTNAGMVQFKDVFIGAEERAYSRATTVQKCLRVSGKHNDLEVVGRTPRHHTFFEMLGNFSFGDYFKEDAIRMAWELLTKVYGMDTERLWVTVYEEDDEAWDLWRSAVDFPAARLRRMDAKENFWSMGATGPCGPCSELHYDLGPTMGAEHADGPAGGTDRYMEIWNLVFMQYDQAQDGSRTSLPRPSIDTGAGLERVAAVLQGKSTNYDTDLFTPLLQQIGQAADVRYGANPEHDVAMRVIADHARATSFLIADGVMPSNEGRGYVLRRIMRRAIRYGVNLGFDKPFLFQTAGKVVQEFGAAYPELLDRQTFIDEVVRGEEERFARTLDRGTKLLEKAMSGLAPGAVLDGDTAFELKDTYGFPIDLTRLMVAERGFGVDEGRFAELEEQQKAQGRKNWKGSGQEAVAGLWHQLAAEHGETEFTGYDRCDDVAAVIGLVKVDGDELSDVDALSAGDTGIVLLNRTPFYAESGGQVGDTGTLGSQGVRFDVADTTKQSGLHLHTGKVAQGTINVGDTLEAHASGGRRDMTRRNHTGTHLLHAALRQVLGDHVQQKGSLVGPNRLRFDFAHHKAMSTDQVRQVEDLVNREILANTAVQTEVKNLDEAKAAGAMALFGEKYDDDVRVVSIPGFSTELCGGTHVRATGDIGLFAITSESGIAAGVRRIEGQTGTGAIAYVRQREDTLLAVADTLKTSPAKAAEAVQRLQDERRALQKQLDGLQRDAAKAAAGDMLSDARDIGGVKVLAAQYDGDLREQADRLRDQLGTALIVLTAQRGPKVQLLVAASKDIAGKRVNAGKLLGQLAPLVGGRGGGRPDMAQGGGTDASGIPALLEKTYELAGEMLGG